MLYALNLYNDVCQLNLNKTGKKKIIIYGRACKCMLSLKSFRIQRKRKERKKEHTNPRAQLPQCHSRNSATILISFQLIPKKKKLGLHSRDY